MQELVFSNEEHMVENNYLPSLGSSAQLLLDLDFNCFININKIAFKIFNFFKGDYNNINQPLLAIPCNET